MDRHEGLTTPIPLRSTQLYTFDGIVTGSKHAKLLNVLSLTNNNAIAAFRATAILVRDAISIRGRQNCCICPILQEPCFQMSKSIVLTETTLGHLRKYATSCPFCYVLYIVVIRYPLSPRQFDRVLRGPGGFDWRNKVVVTQDFNHLKVHVTAHYDDDVHSDAMFLHVKDECTREHYF